ncbi:siderophore-interacting protein [Mumia sp. zg.B17]|uniref:siderophore-interacting protein n=1 Tax=Mumia sp. zg.B17 TaxID=2855446 RepID=UPI001C6E29B7|nr:siderophore-interacting protein [Mumia sp. zg.B17]MBW9207279.1 siderophore-interacting protein [Mumia sp. zg.B17]
MPRHGDTPTLAGPTLTLLDHPIGIQELEVLRRDQLTPRMVRLVLGGDLARWEARAPDEHVKLVFPDPETGMTRAPVADGDHLHWPKPFPPTREYTVRRFDRERGEVWMDFVVHPGGLASDWAESVQPGDRLWVAGPRAGYVAPPAFAYRVVLADHTALPAAARIVEELPHGVRARVALLVPDAAEEQDLVVREGVEVTWLHEDDPEVSDRGFEPFLAGLDLPADEPWTLWAGGEAGLLKPVRRWAKEHGLVNGSTADISGYWKRGRSNAVTPRRRLAHRVKHALRIDDDA